MLQETHRTILLLWHHQPYDQGLLIYRGDGGDLQDALPDPADQEGDEV